MDKRFIKFIIFLIGSKHQHKVLQVTVDPQTRMSSLPKSNLPVFSGGYMEGKSFIDLFKVAVVD